jgi:plastocyanin
VIRGSQSTLVVAGGGTVVELDAIVPETVVLVDHALARTFDKGALGTIVISGAADPEVFGALSGDAGASDEPGDGTANPAADVEVVIPVDGFNPATPELAFDPLEITVKVGTTVQWTNKDLIAHDITSGLSDGVQGEPDGKFQSGFMNEGDVWTYTFTEVGEFPYYCSPHPWMIGKVTVTE